MRFPRRKFLHLAAGAAALPAMSRMASAEAYPARPVTIVVPFAAGGLPDNDAHRPRWIGLRPSNMRHGRQRGSARGQMQKISAGKFHF